MQCRSRHRRSRHRQVRRVPVLTVDLVVCTVVDELLVQIYRLQTLAGPFVQEVSLCRCQVHHHRGFGNVNSDLASYDSL